MKPQLLASEIEWNKWPRLVWRREYYEAPAAVTPDSNAAPGILISTSKTVTITEPSYIRVRAKSTLASAQGDAAWWTGLLNIYEGAGGITQRDQGLGSANIGGSSTWIFGAPTCMYEGYYAAAGSYVFEIRVWSNPTANKVTFSNNKWWIDVCKA